MGPSSSAKRPPANNRQRHGDAACHIRTRDVEPKSFTAPRKKKLGEAIAEFRNNPYYSSQVFTSLEEWFSELVNYMANPFRSRRSDITVEDIRSWYMSDPAFFEANTSNISENASLESGAGNAVWLPCPCCCSPTELLCTNKNSASVAQEHPMESMKVQENMESPGEGMVVNERRPFPQPEAVTPVEPEADKVLINSKGVGPHQDSKVNHCFTISSVQRPATPIIPVLQPETSRTFDQNDSKWSISRPDTPAPPLLEPETVSTFIPAKVNATSSFSPPQTPPLPVLEPEILNTTEHLKIHSASFSNSAPGANVTEMKESERLEEAKRLQAQVVPLETKQIVPDSSNNGMLPQLLSPTVVGTDHKNFKTNVSSAATLFEDGVNASQKKAFNTTATVKPLSESVLPELSSLGLLDAKDDFQLQVPSTDPPMSPSTQEWFNDFLTTLDQTTEQGSEFFKDKQLLASASSTAHIPCPPQPVIDFATCRATPKRLKVYRLGDEIPVKCSYIETEIRRELLNVARTFYHRYQDFKEAVVKSGTGRQPFYRDGIVNRIDRAEATLIALRDELSEIDRIWKQTNNN